MMERLTKKAIGCFQYDLKDHKHINGEFGDYDAFFDYNMAVKRLGEYEDLEEEDRLLVLPCKVGDTVYFIKQTGFHPELIETSIDEVGVRRGGMFIKLGCNSMYRTAISALGKTVFPTREEAEEKLKEIGE